MLPAGLAWAGAYVPEGIKFLLSGDHVLVSLRPAPPVWGSSRRPPFPTPNRVLERFSDRAQPNPGPPSPTFLSEHIWESTCMQHVCVCVQM